MSEEEKFKFKILWNLATRGKGCWGSKYTPKKNVTNGLPGDEIGDCLEVVDELIKEGLLLTHKKRTCVSLNHKRKSEIIEFMKTFSE